MRGSARAAAGLMLAGWGVSACGGKAEDSGASDSGAATSGVAAARSCTAAVDGTPWTASVDASFWSQFHADSLTVTCSSGDGSSGLVINLMGYSGPGTFSLAEGQAQYLGGALSAEPGAWVSSSGEVVVTRDDGVQVEGTFSFEGADALLGTTKTITEGAFALGEGA